MKDDEAVKLAREKVILTAHALSSWLLARAGQPSESFDLRQAIKDYDALSLREREGMPEEPKSEDYPLLDDWLKAIHIERKALRSYALSLREQRKREEVSNEQIRLEQIITEAILLTTDGRIAEFLRRNCPRWTLHTAAPSAGREGEK